MYGVLKGNHVFPELPAIIVFMFKGLVYNSCFETNYISVVLLNYRCLPSTVTFWHDPRASSAVFYGVKIQLRYECLMFI